MAACVTTSQSKGRHDLEPDRAPQCRVHPSAAYPASLAGPTLSRQTPKVGAECPNRARSVLCGGRLAMSVPTAILDPLLPVGIPKTRQSNCKKRTSAEPQRYAALRAAAA